MSLADLPAQRSHCGQTLFLCQEVQLDLIKAACETSAMPPWQKEVWSMWRFWKPPSGKTALGIVWPTWNVIVCAIRVRWESFPSCTQCWEAADRQVASWFQHKCYFLTKLVCATLHLGRQNQQVLRDNRLSRWVSNDSASKGLIKSRQWGSNSIWSLVQPSFSPGWSHRIMH